MMSKIFQRSLPCNSVPENPTAIWAIVIGTALSLDQEQQNTLRALVRSDAYWWAPELLEGLQDFELVDERFFLLPLGRAVGWVLEEIVTGG